MERQAVTVWPVAETREEDSLVSAARDGDRAAFGCLYDRYARMVHGILLARVPPREVDDLVQEVFLLALRQFHALRDVSRFGAWLGTITRNRANDRFRKSIPDAKVTEPVSEDQAESRTANHAAEQEAAVILAVVRALPEPHEASCVSIGQCSMPGGIPSATATSPSGARTNTTGRSPRRMPSKSHAE